MVTRADGVSCCFFGRTHYCHHPHEWQIRNVRYQYNVKQGGTRELSSLPWPLATTPRSLALARVGGHGRAVSSRLVSSSQPGNHAWPRQPPRPSTQCLHGALPPSPALDDQIMVSPPFGHFSIHGGVPTCTAFHPFSLETSPGRPSYPFSFSSLPVLIHPSIHDPSSEIRKGRGGRYLNQNPGPPHPLRKRTRHISRRFRRGAPKKKSFILQLLILVYVQRVSG